MAAPRTVIAIVDDDEVVRRSIKRLINSFSFHADDFSSGEEFLRSLSSGAPTCMLLDLHMPGLSGFEVLEALKMRRMNIPTIIITGNSRPEMRERCLNAGAAGYLEKPLDREVVLSTIRAATTAA